MPAQHIDPWTVSGGADGKIDYNKLLEQVRHACAWLCRHACIPAATIAAHRLPRLRHSCVLQFGCSKLTEELIARCGPAGEGTCNSRAYSVAATRQRLGAACCIDAHLCQVFERQPAADSCTEFSTAQPSAQACHNHQPSLSLCCSPHPSRLTAQDGAADGETSAPVPQARHLLCT